MTAGIGRHVIVLEDGQRLVTEASHSFRNVRVYIPGTAVVFAVPIEHADTFALSIQACAADVVATDKLTGAEG